MHALNVLKDGAGAPLREPVLSEQEQKSMLSYYYHKQEEIKVQLKYVCKARFLKLSFAETTRR
jgi:hypothetical protein